MSDCVDNKFVIKFPSILLNRYAWKIPGVVAWKLIFIMKREFVVLNMTPFLR